MTHQLTPSLQLTTESPLSRYGIPALRHANRDDLGPADMLDYGGQLWPAAKHVQRFAKHHLDNQDLQQSAAAFCRQWPDGPQIETEAASPQNEYIILSENRGDYITYLEFKPDGKFNFLGGPYDDAIRYTLEQATEAVENLGRGFAVEPATRYELRIQLDRQSLCWTGIEWAEESPKLYQDTDEAREDIPEAIEALKPGMGWASSDRPSILIMDHDEDGGLVGKVYLDEISWEELARPEQILELVKARRLEPELLVHWGTGSVWEDFRDRNADDPEFTDDDLRAAIQSLLNSDYDCTTAQEWIGKIGSL